MGHMELKHLGVEVEIGFHATRVLEDGKRVVHPWWKNADVGDWVRIVVYRGKSKQELYLQKLETRAGNVELSVDPLGASFEVTVTILPDRDGAAWLAQQRMHGTLPIRVP